MTAAGDPGASHVDRVDPAVVAQLVVDLGPGSVVEVGEVFHADGRQQLSAIRAACASGDARGAAGSAHRLRSASGFLGARRMVLLCAEIEALAREGRLGEVPQRVDDATEELEAAVLELAALVQAERPPEPGADGPVT